ncbi:hypothetical protein CERSUDRAFT_116976 [Gelatoporia subvermispora B]|uniref:F-box domain-containing protein n=1 Tax=Ceriporiopsis subvermispora (strain B) TaxID=914234 RepID=M2QRH8_CERS8|nr:hypothetical protein CERSUDRAFT_116976 [Gelatoporia subvermispora B]
MHELDFLIELCRISHSSCFITDYISPFLELSNLRIVNIYISHSKQPVISLSEGELISFADTWPQLEQMFIGFGSSYEHRLSNVATTPSINGLARLALKLPSLTYLSLPCTRLRQEDLWADVPPGSQHGLKELHISHVCPVNDRTLIAPVAEFLNFVFPSVTIYDDLRKAVVHE